MRQVVSVAVIVIVVLFIAVAVFVAVTGDTTPVHEGTPIEGSLARLVAL